MYRWKSCTQDFPQSKQRFYTIRFTMRTNGSKEASDWSQKGGSTRTPSVPGDSRNNLDLSDAKLLCFSPTLVSSSANQLPYEDVNRTEPVRVMKASPLKSKPLHGSNAAGPRTRSSTSGTSPAAPEPALGFLLGTVRVVRGGWVGRSARWCCKTSPGSGSGPAESHEGVVRRGSVGEAREGAGRLLDAAGHHRRVAAQGGRHRQVGELRVKVPQVGGTGLQNREPRVSCWVGTRTRAAKGSRFPTR